MRERPSPSPAARTQRSVLPTGAAVLLLLMSGKRPRRFVLAYFAHPRGEKEGSLGIDVVKKRRRCPPV
jgi:hypothetical protein